MGMLSLADILLTDAQVSYKENRIILYFKSDAEVNPIFKEHVRSLYAKFVKQESVSVTIGEHSSYYFTGQCCVSGGICIGRSR